MNDSVIQIVGLINGGTTSFDGQYVVDYDPSRNGVEPSSGFPMCCYLETTPDRDKATRFEIRDAFALYQQVDPRHTIRPDGKPNRPLTAFTVTIEKVSDHG
jgi:hypothetical protein